MGHSTPKNSNNNSKTYFNAKRFIKKVLQHHQNVLGYKMRKSESAKTILTIDAEYLVMQLSNARKTLVTGYTASPS